MTSRASLIESTQSLLHALTTNSPITTITSTFTSSPEPLIHEHGLQQLAPFLGRSFTGADGISQYFDILSQFLEIKSMDFEPDSEWIVDESTMCVCLRGTATFIWKETNNSWGETFVYRIKLAREDSGAKKGQLLVSEYKVWADTGAAYLARIGRLRDDGNSGRLNLLGSGLNVYGSCG
ncbi:hypothetical protein N7456_000699 [Penicillium angulare]|uniref:SnoaL-like domain-containing protein n=1 Tax=Penicillium angulare TaxID=116970 RepID=A0A9W9GCM3_9EURO|nr:hypothetical protein N7456_000699 [Penicillium angulare]